MMVFFSLVSIAHTKFTRKTKTVFVYLLIIFVSFLPNAFRRLSIAWSVCFLSRSSFRSCLFLSALFSLRM